jgi:outer membrane protein assembly factor BamB
MVSPDGSKVFVTGVTGQGSSTATGSDYATIAYDSTSGSELWVKRYNGPGSGTDAARALGMSPDGSKVFVSGYSTGSTSHGDFATVAYAASTGTKLWVSRYNGPSNSTDGAYALGVSPGGRRLFVTGGSIGSSSGNDYATVAYTASKGAELWVKRYNGAANGGDGARALGVSPDGSEVFVTGISGGSSGQDYATAAYDASTGAKLWVTRYDGNYIDVADGLAVAPDGSKVFVTGYSQASTSGSEDYATAAYDASTGSQLWTRSYNGPGDGTDIARAVAVSLDGSEVFVTGQSTGSAGPYDYATVAYDTSVGTKLWVSRYNATTDLSDQDQAFALGVSADGSKLFVSGQTAGSSNDQKYATVAYRLI